jgi:hypothetical protein
MSRRGPKKNQFNEIEPIKPIMTIIHVLDFFRRSDPLCNCDDFFRDLLLLSLVFLNWFIKIYWKYPQISLFWMKPPQKNLTIAFYRFLQPILTIYSAIYDYFTFFKSIFLNLENIPMLQFSMKLPQKKNRLSLCWRKTPLFSVKPIHN